MGSEILGVNASSPVLMFFHVELGRVTFLASSIGKVYIGPLVPMNAG